MTAVPCGPQAVSNGNASPGGDPRRRSPAPAMSEFAHVREDRLRLSDLDFQQHVNNAALTHLLANARFEFLGEQVRPKLAARSKLVIASLEVTFLREVVYGHPVFTGTRVLDLGRSSMRLEQALYQEGRCALQAVCVFVHVGEASASSTPWPDPVRELLAGPCGTRPGIESNTFSNDD